MNKVFEACNWNAVKDERVLMFWEQNVRQFWIDTEIPIAKDLKSWKGLSQDERDIYKKVLAGLTLLDTTQGNVGMPSIAMNVQDLTVKAVLMFMAAMEEVHQKSYSTIFTTLATKEEIYEVFEWVKENKYLQRKAALIEFNYRTIESKLDLYMALTSSVFLESFLFYSGFYYPLLLSGNGVMVNSGEIINLILRDEQIHGSFCGMIAQDLYFELTNEEQEYADKETYELLEMLMDNEINYTNELYGVIGLNYEVVKFLKYNANKALQNLGRNAYYEDEEINSIVFNGLRTDTKTHDFFSVKGNGYSRGKVESLTDADFIFN
jgi:ribonucleoside-diphosphate reductase beta chain